MTKETAKSFKEDVELRITILTFGKYHHSTSSRRPHTPYVRYVTRIRSASVDRSSCCRGGCPVRPRHGRVGMGTRGILKIKDLTLWSDVIEAVESIERFVALV